jgi:hypothetical protein
MLKPLRPIKIRAVSGKCGENENFRFFPVVKWKKDKIKVSNISHEPEMFGTGAPLTIP